MSIVIDKSKCIGCKSVAMSAPEVLSRLTKTAKRTSNIPRIAGAAPPA